MPLGSLVHRRQRPAPAIECKQVTRVAHLVRLRGELGREDAAKVKLRLAAIVDRGGTEVVVDLAEARSIDPAVVDVLLLTAKQLRGAGGELLLAAAVEGRDSYVLKAVEPDEPAKIMGLQPALDRALGELRRQVPAVTVWALVDSA